MNGSVGRLLFIEDQNIFCYQVVKYCFNSEKDSLVDKALVEFSPINFCFGKFST